MTALAVALALFIAAQGIYIDKLMKRVKALEAWQARISFLCDTAAGARHEEKA